MVGVASESSRQRDRMVTTTSSEVGAQRIQTVAFAGSSMLLSSASAPRSVTRSASSTTITWRCRMVGLIAARRTRSRTSSTPIDSCSVRTSVTSGCAPLSAVRQPLHSPQPASTPPGRSHCSAAAKARAAFERPEPGGPTTSQACDMAWLSPRAARRSVSTAASCPTRSPQTPYAAGRVSVRHAGSVPAGADRTWSVRAAIAAASSSRERRAGSTR